MSHLRYAPTHLFIGFLWLTHWLPLPILRAFSAGLGHLLYFFAYKRLRVGMINLSLCFPEKSEKWKKDILRRHIVLLAQALFDRSKITWSSFNTIKKMIHIVNEDQLPWQEGEPVLLLGMHCAGIEAAGTIVSLQTKTPCATIYAKQKNVVFERWVLQTRLRFNFKLIQRRKYDTNNSNIGIREVLRVLKKGHPLFYFPDQDLGKRDSIFVPFFGVPTATITATSRLMGISKAKLVPYIAHLTSRGYEVEFFPAWENFPGESLEEDTARISQFFEEQTRKAPEQYFWLHKRFKTRPDNQPNPYQQQ